jgi:hypothetical protein
VLCTLVRASPLPLSDQLMQFAFPAIVQVGRSKIQHIRQGFDCLIFRNLVVSRYWFNMGCNIFSMKGTVWRDISRKTHFAEGDP